MKINLANIYYESLVNGPGVRRVLFSQGCTHNCKGCFNPTTHPFKKVMLCNTDILVRDIITNPFLNGVTFSGGDPMQQAEPFLNIATQLRKFKSDYSIWCYTGYTFEQLLALKDDNVHQLLNNISVLVDGKFDITKKDENLKYRGSSNQRIIDVEKTLKAGHVITLSF